MRGLLLLSVLLPLAACDSSGPDTVPEDGLPRAVARSVADLSSSAAAPFTLTLDDTGRTRSPFGSSTVFSDANPTVLDRAWLWVAGTQGGTLRASARNNPSLTGGPCEGGSGVFHLFADTTYAADGWPTASGAPTDAAGRPRVYGDEMLWTTCKETLGIVSQPTFEGLRLNTAVFRYASTPQTVFVRYEMINTSAVPMTDVTVGLFADPDLAPRTGGELNDNLVGLDRARALSYVYFDQLRDDGVANPAGTRRTDAQRGLVAGAVLLETPRGVGLTSSRVVTRNLPAISLYREPTGSNAADYTRALESRLFDGTPQIDWTTGLESAFAFTGDPVAKTGWLDGTGPLVLRPESLAAGDQEGRDVRLVMASGLSSLGPGESATLTVAWAVERQPTLGAALAALRQRTDAVRAAPSLWRF